MRANEFSVRIFEQETRSPSYSPATQRVQNDYKKNYSSTFAHSKYSNYLNASDLEEERQDDEILESPLDTKARNDRDRYTSPEYTSTHQSLFSTDLHIRETTSYHSDQSFSKLEVASSYRSPQERAADLIHDHDGESKIPKELQLQQKVICTTCFIVADAPRRQQQQPEGREFYQKINRLCALLLL